MSNVENSVYLKMVDRSGRRFSSGGSNLDEPPNSRLFIIGSKILTEDHFKEAFEEFGTIEEIRSLRDRQTGENKGKRLLTFNNIITIAYRSHLH